MYIILYMFENLSCHVLFNTLTYVILLYGQCVLLETKTLVELIRHYIRDQVRVFSVFHPCE
jgi:hypothetical protein